MFIRLIGLKNFTVFREASLDFATGLNVFIGENGTGKSHLLKLCYSALVASQRTVGESVSIGPTKTSLQGALARKLQGVFKPDHLGRLARRERSGKQRCEVAFQFTRPSGRRSGHLKFAFNTASKTEVTVDRLPTHWVDQQPVYLPTHELLTIYPGFVSLYDTTYLPFEETWRDTSLLLGTPLARGARESRIRQALNPLEEAMGGRVELDEGGRFYLINEGVRTEMHLVAEGLRKLAMIARLVATGSLLDKGFLFWDEPESNLNPRIMKTLARTILRFCQSGIQVFIASHSLFLVRELDICLQSEEFKDETSNFVGLTRGDRGVEARQADSVDEIGPISALEEELGQSDRYLDLGNH